MGHTTMVDGAGGASGPAGARGARRWRVPLAAVLVALVALGGLVTALYPSIAAWFSQLDQSKVIVNAVANAGAHPAEEAEQLKAARRYNDSLSAGAIVASGQRLPEGAGHGSSGLKYADMLVNEPTGVMARLRIPSINLDLPVYHGTDDATLLRGLGHLEGTSLPVGGPGTHAVITGHRGLASATMFTELDRVHVGDTFTVEVMGQVLSYRVSKSQVVDPDDTRSLGAVAGQDLVTLVTCTPLGINSQRILLTGERITPTPQEDLDRAGKAPDIPGFPWWALLLAGGVLVAGAYVWWAGYPPKRRKAARAAGEQG